MRMPDNGITPSGNMHADSSIMQAERLDEIRHAIYVAVFVDCRAGSRHTTDTHFVIVPQQAGLCR